MKLYSFFRSSAAYRVRIALNLKNLAYETLPVHLVKDGGHNKRPEFRAVNPQMRVPVLVAPSGELLIQSPAIIEYLEETHPEPPLLPKDPLARAQVRALADIIACDIHPLNNVGPLRYLVRRGFEALEALVRPAPYAFGAEVTLADVFLVPQVYNARRLKVPLDAFPKIVGIEAACLALAAFDRARPEKQPDAE
jgi:maleylpyruvate isomerase